MKRVIEPWTDGRPEPLEILSRLAGSTTFRVPAGGGKATISIDDISHALGRVSERLSALIAGAIACGRVKEWPQIHAAAYPRLHRQLTDDRRTRQLVVGAKRYRIRLVLHDAFLDLVHQREVNWTAGAKKCRMQRRTYRELHHAVTGYLRTEAVSAAHEAMTHLFNKH